MTDHYYVRRLREVAPELTNEQVGKIAELMEEEAQLTANIRDLTLPQEVFSREKQDRVRKHLVDALRVLGLELPSNN